MRTIHVTRSIPAPAEAVFDLLADHASYERFRGIRRPELLSEGEPAAERRRGDASVLDPARSASRRRSPPTTAPRGSTI